MIFIARIGRCCWDLGGCVDRLLNDTPRYLFTSCATPSDEGPFDRGRVGSHPFTGDATLRNGSGQSGGSRADSPLAVHVNLARVQDTADALARDVLAHARRVKATSIPTRSPAQGAAQHGRTRRRQAAVDARVGPLPSGRGT
jgi:hypothetical protein